MISKNNFDQISSDVPSCIDTVSRKDFLRKVLKGSLLAGSAVTGAKILDRFLIPPAYASSSPNCNTSAAAGDTNGNCDISTINMGLPYITTCETYNSTSSNPGGPTGTCYYEFYTGTTGGLETLCGAAAADVYVVPVGCRP